MKIKVENSYSDGHESTVEYEVPDADVAGLSDEELDLFLFDYTGDGHGAANPKLGTYHVVTILDSPVPSLVGYTVDYDS